MFYVAQVPLSMNEKALEVLDNEARRLIKGLLEPLERLNDWSESTIENTIKTYADQCGIKLGKIALPLRAALTGSNISPNIFEVATVLGWDEVNLRVKSVC
jgi:glutamyl-tRNA synthetase